MTTLKKVVDACIEDWDEHISAALYAHRISPRAFSKLSPFFLTYNRQSHKANSLAMAELESGDPEVGVDKDKENDGDEESEEEDSEDVEAVVEKLLDGSKKAIYCRANFLPLSANSGDHI